MTKRMSGEIRKRVWELWNNGENLTLAAIGRKVGYTPTALSYLLRDHLGVTHKEISERHRIDASKRSKSIVRTETWRKNISNATKASWQKPEMRKKQVAAMQGVKKSQAAIEKMRESLRNKWKDPEYKASMEARMMGSRWNRPTSLETKFMIMCNNLGLPSKYVGNGTCFVGGRNPDFIIPYAKIAIEVSNRYHHGGDWFKDTLAHYESCGWKVFIFFEDELSEELVLTRLAPLFTEYNQISLDIWAYAPQTTIICKGCGKPFSVKPSHIHRSKCCSVDCRRSAKERERLAAQSNISAGV